jgi:hypothetical protein
MTLTALDRCDRCRAPGRALTKHEKNRPSQESDTLVWCSHHYNKHKAHLAQHLVFWQPDNDDETSKEPART